jgi:ComF family protein
MADVTSLAQSLLDVVFPPRCVNCHARGALLCQRCRATIAIPPPPLCARCGRALLTAGEGTQCASCVSGHGPVHLKGLRAATVYDGAMRAAILAYRFHGIHRLAQPLSELLAEANRREGRSADLVLHVPLHAARRRQRGYDQAELLARNTAQRLRLPFLTRAVTRVRATAPQTHLQGDERIANVAQAFALTDARIAPRLHGRHLLLIDDVTATGSTLDATAAALAIAQPATIWGLALSRPTSRLDRDRQPTDASAPYEVF